MPPNARSTPANAAGRKKKDAVDIRNLECSSAWDSEVLAVTESVTVVGVPVPSSAGEAFEKLQVETFAGSCPHVRVIVPL